MVEDDRAWDPKGTSCLLQERGASGSCSQNNIIFMIKSFFKKNCSTRSSRTWSLPPGGHNLWYTIVATLAETYGQQAGILNQCLNGQWHIYSTCGENRDWIDQVRVEEPVSDRPRLDGNDGARCLRRPRLQTGSSCPSWRKHSRRLTQGIVMRQEREEMESDLIPLREYAIIANTGMMLIMSHSSNTLETLTY